MGGPLHSAFAPLLESGAAKAESFSCCVRICLLPYWGLAAMLRQLHGSMHTAQVAWLLTEARATAVLALATVWNAKHAVTCGRFWLPASSLSGRLCAGRVAVLQAPLLSSMLLNNVCLWSDVSSNAVPRFVGRESQVVVAGAAGPVLTAPCRAAWQPLVWQVVLTRGGGLMWALKKYSGLLSVFYLWQGCITCVMGPPSLGQNMPLRAAAALHMLFTACNAPLPAGAGSL